MSIPDLTLDQDATIRILDHRVNTRSRLQNFIDVLEDTESVVLTAKFFPAGDSTLDIGSVYQEVLTDKNRYVQLDSEFGNLYAGYAASQWKTDVTAAITALNDLMTWMVTAFNNNFKAVDPADKWLIDQLSNGQKTTFATQIGNALG